MPGGPRNTVRRYVYSRIEKTVSRALFSIGRRSAAEVFMQFYRPTMSPCAREIRSAPLIGAQSDHGHELAEIVSELQEYFDTCDKDDDGRIRYEEFLRLLGYLRARLSNPECERWFQKMDNDHDGFIDIRQFVAGWME
jgi:hypothetical protein